MQKGVAFLERAWTQAFAGWGHSDHFHAGLHRDSILRDSCGCMEDTLALPACGASAFGRGEEAFKAASGAPHCQFHGR